MALIVEDGTGKADADSPSTMGELDAFHLRLGNAEWAAASVPDKEVAARRGSMFLEGRYSANLANSRTYVNQALSFPRSRYGLFGFYIPYEPVLASGTIAIPRAWKEAHAIASLLALKGKLDIAPKPRGGQVRKSKVGPMEQEMEPGATAETTYPEIENALVSLFAPLGQLVYG